MLTEIITFELKDSGGLSDNNFPGSKVILDFLEFEVKAPAATNAYYGRLIEKPDTVIMFVNWQSLEGLEDSMKSPEYEIKLKELKTIINEDAPMTVLHVPFAPSDDPSPGFGDDSRVGVTEITYFYFPSTLTDNEKESIMAASKDMGPVMKRSEALQVYSGWALQDSVPNPGPHQSGENCRIRVTIVAWVDVEAHMRFQRSQDFKENIHHILGNKLLKHMELYHVKLQRV